MADHAYTPTRAPGTLPAAFSPSLPAAHYNLIARLLATKPSTIRYVADAADLKERAEHVRDVFDAFANYVGAVMRDTADPASIVICGNQPFDRKYIGDRLSDISGDVAGALDQAADRLQVEA
jgi:hypothetical protein